MQADVLELARHVHDESGLMALPGFGLSTAKWLDQKVSSYES